MQKIPMLDIGAQNQPLMAEMMSALQRVMESGAFVMGPEVKSFEDEFCAGTRVPHAVACASGSDALLLPLMALEIGAGDEVLVPSFTFYATVAAVARVGATPVFVDSDETYNIDLRDLERKITPKTRAVIPVHLFGQMVDMPALLRLTRERGIHVIEDCAQSIGAELGGKPCGAWGDFGAFSFYPTKNLGAAGDAGLVTVTDQALAQRLRMLRVHGSSTRYYHELLGINSRLDSLQAAILRVKLRHLKEYEDGRQRVARQYLEQFRASGLAAREKLRVPESLPGRKHVWNQFTIRSPRRDELRAHLSDMGIGTEIYYPLAMHRQQAFRKFQISPASLPFCEQLEKEVLSLPMYPELPASAVSRVVDAISSFWSRG